MTPTSRHLLGSAALAATLAWALAWLLAGGQAAPAQSAVRAVADCAAVVALGLAVVPALDEVRHRADMLRATTGPLLTVSVTWLLAEGVRLAISAAQAADVPLSHLRLATASEFVTTIAGRAGLISLVCAAAAILATVIGPGETAGRIVVAAAVATGLGARAVSGHLADGTVGALAIVVHILAAALWCGGLAAIALTVEHRGQWARILPRFSGLALVCVVALLTAGTLGALVTVASPGALMTTGYGRLVLAKALVAALLLLLGWLNRSGWVPAARAHRITATQSRGRAQREIALMVVALTLGAALSVAG
ncbi:CopD family protein [Mycobacterium sp. NBC_00419]|uniref:copper resistance D family protein n=1 Tax=Mycobacterium sp. NBC_00419 TaxID=2975989 RepID=UPI002E21C2B7